MVSSPAVLDDNSDEGKKKKRRSSTKSEFEYVSFVKPTDDTLDRNDSISGHYHHQVGVETVIPFPRERTTLHIPPRSFQHQNQQPLSGIQVEPMYSKAKKKKKKSDKMERLGEKTSLNVVKEKVVQIPRYYYDPDDDGDDDSGQSSPKTLASVVSRREEMINDHRRDSTGGRGSYGDDDVGLRNVKGRDETFHSTCLRDETRNIVVSIKKELKRFDSISYSVPLDERVHTSNAVTFHDCHADDFQQ